jgi:hypothetical protein
MNDPLLRERHVPPDQNLRHRIDPAVVGSIEPIQSLYSQASGSIREELSGNEFV